MTVTVAVMIVVGLILCIVSFFVSENITKSEENIHKDLMTLDEDYEFSERELRIIRRKIEEVIANQAKDILYETNESLSGMANEKTMALGDYAVAVCDEIEKNHKEVMFLYSMLDDKQKEIMKTVEIIDELNHKVNDTIGKVLNDDMKYVESKYAEMESTETRKNNRKRTNKQNSNKKNSEKNNMGNNSSTRKQTVNSQLNKLVTMKKDVESEEILSDLADNGIVAEEIIIHSLEEENTNNASKNTLNDKKGMKDNGSRKSLIDESENSKEAFTELNQPVDIDFEDTRDSDYSDNENLNEVILDMHQHGESLIEIAKQLGLGVGEVKLVIDLYRGE